ncbi:hypothetical protein B0H67DRAFT_575689 [Lasiosphaeris hirsuta]|uniref:Uncharacterized protein n=1 Tax=Lasiosphaeris hirsuta TaxID=260670 RepID=A0AA40E0E2_9PEZI|nr:hypothetical protein B0H67DRAFT_575689 [Lasiosphaeris hirsuta]
MVRPRPVRCGLIIARIPNPCVDPPGFCSAATSTWPIALARWRERALVACSPANSSQPHVSTS